MTRPSARTGSRRGPSGARPSSRAASSSAIRFQAKMEWAAFLDGAIVGGSEVKSFTDLTELVKGARRSLPGSGCGIAHRSVHPRGPGYNPKSVDALRVVTTARDASGRETLVQLEQTRNFETGARPAASGRCSTAWCCTSASGRRTDGNGHDRPDAGTRRRGAPAAGAEPGEVRVTAVVLAAVIAFAFVSTLVLTRTDWGQERVRRFVLDQMAGMVHGKVSIGRIRGNLLTGATIVRSCIRDSAETRSSPRSR